MGPILIMDKSAIQSLSFSELLILHETFLLNIVPVLMVEILGDIKKPVEGSLSKEKVSELAGKVFPFNSAVNMHYHDLLRMSLLGGQVPLDRRPILTGGSQVETTEGEKGIIIEEPPEEKALRRWKDGDFTVAEEILGERWRQSTQDFDLEGLTKTLQSLMPKFPSITDLAKLDQFLTQAMEHEKAQRDLLKLTLEKFRFTVRDAQRTFLRWERLCCPPLQLFAPYAYHCIRVHLFFMMGLHHNLIGTRATNRVDAEYLYYLPFCMVFCSNDKFHRRVAPFVIRKNQRFITGTDLKADLKKRIQHEDEVDGNKAHAQSLTDELWSDFMAGPRENYPNLADGMDAASRNKIMDFIQSKLDKSRPSTDGSKWNTQQANFVIRKRTITLTDACPCGSGKRFGECHGSKIAK